MIKKVLLVFLILILNINVLALDNKGIKTEEFYEDVTINEELVSQYGIIESEEDYELVENIEVETNSEPEKKDNNTFDVIFIIMCVIFVILLILTIIEIVKERRRNKDGQYGF